MLSATERKEGAHETKREGRSAVSGSIDIAKARALLAVATKKSDHRSTDEVSQVVEVFGQALDEIEKMRARLTEAYFAATDIAERLLDAPLRVDLDGAIRASRDLIAGEEIAVPVTTLEALQRITVSNDPLAGGYPRDEPTPVAAWGFKVPRASDMCYLTVSRADFDAGRWHLPQGAVAIQTIASAAYGTVKIEIEYIYVDEKAA